MYDIIHIFVQKSSPKQEKFKHLQKDWAKNQFSGVLKPFLNVQIAQITWAFCEKKALAAAGKSWYHNTKWRVKYA